MPRAKHTRSADGSRKIITPIVEVKDQRREIRTPTAVEQRDDPKKIKPGKGTGISLLETVNFNVPSLTADRALETNDEVLAIKGRIVGMVVLAESGTPERGQCYAQVTIARGGTDPANDMFELGRGYATARTGPHGAGSIPVELNDRVVIRTKTSTAATLLVRLTYTTEEVGDVGWVGTDEDSLSGRGFMNILQIADDEAGNVITTADISNSDQYRIVRGFVLLYNADGNPANRIAIPGIRRHLTPTVPTGFSSTNTQEIWNVSGPTVTANQEGMIYATEGGMVTTLNDQTSVTYRDHVVAPNPFPIKIIAADTAVDVQIAIPAGLAGDRYDVSLLVEDWIDFDA